jgi:hypothetical protein
MATVNGAVSGSTAGRGTAGADPDGFPFRCELSLAPLITFWTQLSAYHEFGRGPIPGLVREKAREAPELARMIDDQSVIGTHQTFVDLMMTALFPPAFWEQEYGAALFPFHLRAFYATPPFRRSLMNADGTLLGLASFLRKRTVDPTMAAERLALTYELILERVYGVELGGDVPVMIFTTSDSVTGLDQHFRLQFDWRFVDVEVVGSKPPLPDGVRQRVKTGRIDGEELRALLPPERFVLRGFMIVKAVDVTDQEVLSSIKRDLIDKDSIVSSSHFQGLQAKLRTFFRRPDLRLGLAAVEGDRVLVLSDASRHEQACIFADSAHHTTAEYRGSLYERVVVEDRPIVIEDLTEYSGRTPVEEELIQSGVRTIVCAPLHYQDRVIGTLELASAHVGALSATHLPKLQEVLPLFSMAVQRSVEELNSRIQTVINEQCTAIHPTVEWRFRKAVLNAFDRGSASKVTELEPIVFEGVYPLYGLADIRGSSTQRGRAIQADLLQQLRLARAVVQSASETRPGPALDELAYRIDSRTAQIERGLSSSDEIGLIAFLRAEVEGLLDHLGTFGAGVREQIVAYRAGLDARVGTVYHRRRMFEESVTSIAETISSYLELEQQAAQARFPHYFEKQKTDGVDYQIYVGPALLENGRVDPLCLKNLRLWQLMITCGMAARAHQLRDGLPILLETTHLILVQHAPLSIRFRFDEKRFDVDGAYDIRYEIMKKRIDKALVEGTTERVTQPGKVALVYSQPGEALEYRAYIEYLQSLGYLTGRTEQLDLEELQGVQGLRALRVQVDLDNPKLQDRINLADLHVAPGLRG